MKSIKANNTLECLGLDTLEGLVAFCILTSHFVETCELITATLLDFIFRGQLGTVVNGGKLSDPATEIPYAMRNLVRTYISSVIDADADSSQASAIRTGMAELAMDIGKLDLARATRYAGIDHGLLLGVLLGEENYLQHDGDMKVFNTFFGKNCNVDYGYTRNSLETAKVLP
jgi:hypothetical protein